MPAEAYQCVLPYETCDHILSFLTDDLASLLTCALVSKSWLPISRRLAFENRPVTLAKLRKLWPDSSASPDNSASYSGLPTITPYITKLVIEDPRFMWKLSKSSTDTEVFSILAKFPFNAMKSLRMLTLMNLDYGVLSVESTLALQSLFGIPEHINLHYVRFSTELELIRMLVKAVHLRTLTMITTEYMDISQEIILEAGLKPPKVLQSIELSQKYYLGDPQFLAWAALSPSIEYVSLHLENKEHVVSLVPVLHIHFREKLKHLAIAFKYRAQVSTCDAIAEFLDLTLFPNLATISLDATYISQRHHDTNYEWVCHLLVPLSTVAIPSGIQRTINFRPSLRLLENSGGFEEIGSVVHQIAPLHKEIGRLRVLLPYDLQNHDLWWFKLETSSFASLLDECKAEVVFQNRGEEKAVVIRTLGK